MEPPEPEAGFVTLGEFSTRAADRLLEQFQAENIPFQLEVDTSPPRQHAYAMNADHPTAWIYVRRESEARARRLASEAEALR